MREPPHVANAAMAQFWTATAAGKLAEFVDALRYEAAGGVSPTDARLRLAEAVRQLQVAAAYMKKVQTRED